MRGRGGEGFRGEDDSGRLPCIIGLCKGELRGELKCLRCALALFAPRQVKQKRLCLRRLRMAGSREPGAMLRWGSPARRSSSSVGRVA